MEEKIPPRLGLEIELMARKETPSPLYRCTDMYGAGWSPLLISTFAVEDTTRSVRMEALTAGNAFCMFQIPALPTVN
jgi:hypothetical protein